MYETLKKEIEHLPAKCIRPDFITPYIDDYNFSLENELDENNSFIFEIQKMHGEKLANIIISSILQESQNV